MNLLASLSESKRTKVLRKFTDEEFAAFRYEWELWARPNQLPPPGDWRKWLLLAGRGFGKSRAGAEYIRMRVNSGAARRIALVACTPADARDVMIEGESGLLNIYPEGEAPLYEPSKRRITWANGAIATIYSGHDPDQLRGPQHDTAWCDEIAAWQYARDTWDMLQLGLRLGDPKCVITTTPKPISLLKEILGAKDTVVTRGSTFENRANLAQAFFDTIVARYEGTSLGQQELYAQMLEESPGALWTRELISETRVRDLPSLTRRVVSIDPAGGATEENDETGIISCGIGEDGHLYVFRDDSGRYSPDGWGRRAITAYEDIGADRILAEKNYGGDMVGAVIQLVGAEMGYDNVPVKLVSAEKKSKYVRAEPVAALFEQRRAHIVGSLQALEDQLCTWVPNEATSPDRLDAMVYGGTELMLGKKYHDPRNLAVPGKGTSRWR